MKQFLNETMVETARDIYVDDVEKINTKFFDILLIIGKYHLAKKSFKNKFVIFLVNWCIRLLNQGY